MHGTTCVHDGLAIIIWQAFFFTTLIFAPSVYGSCQPSRRTAQFFDNSFLASSSVGAHLGNSLFSFVALGYVGRYMARYEVVRRALVWPNFGWAPRTSFLPPPFCTLLSSLWCARPVLNIHAFPAQLFRGKIPFLCGSQHTSACLMPHCLNRLLYCTLLPFYFSPFFPILASPPWVLLQKKCNKKLHPVLRDSFGWR